MSPIGKTNFYFVKYCSKKITKVNGYCINMWFNDTVLIDFTNRKYHAPNICICPLTKSSS